MLATFSMFLAVVAQGVIPSPSATVSPCANREVMRLTSEGAAPSETPPAIARLIYASILVTVNPNGSVKGAVFAHRTGFANSDGAVMNLAQSSQYLPKILDCKAVEGTYLLVQPVVLP